MILTSSVNTNKIILVVDRQELDLVNLSVEELRDSETGDESKLSSFEVAIRIDAATFAESLSQQRQRIPGLDCEDEDNDSEPVPNWMNANED